METPCRTMMAMSNKMSTSSDEVFYPPTPWSDKEVLLVSVRSSNYPELPWITDECTEVIQGGPGG